VAVSLIPLGASKFVGIEYAGDAINYKGLGIATLTIGSMVGINIWSRGKLKLYCVLIGLIVGYLLSFLFGVLTTYDLKLLWESAWFDFPGVGQERLKFAFHWSMVLPFMVVSMCASLKSFGNLTTCQKINNTKWKEPDMKNIGKGLFADGIAVFLGGLLGGMAVDTSASNVGLSSATSATSRRIAIYAGGLFICLGFLPKLAGIFSIMPDPVMGAIVIFVTCFMIVSGIQILLSSKMDVRKTFIIGIAFVFGLSAVILPNLYSGVPGWIRPIFTSALTLSTVLAVLLNLLFSLGKSNKNKSQ